MSDSSFEVGAYVRHTKMPSWGPGKVVHTSGTDIHVVFRDDDSREARAFRLPSEFLRLAEVQTDPILENLPPFKLENGKWVLSQPRITLAIARCRFLERYPLAFEDKRYLEEEREYKWRAHELFLERLGHGQLTELLSNGNLKEIAQRLNRIAHVNLLSPYEQMGFGDALTDESATREFATALDAVLSAETVQRSVYQRYLECVSTLPKTGKASVATWPIATLFPYLAQPDRHMFLKPQTTKEAADSLAFDLHYDSTLNWSTYEALLRMGKTYMDQLADLAPRDYIDVQSFIWVACRVPH